MSRKDREQQEKRRLKEMERIRQRNQEAENNPEVRERAIQALNNPISRKVVAYSSRGAFMEEIENASTTDQIGVLEHTASSSSKAKQKVKAALMSKAPGEMDKAIRKFQREGKEISVESLTAEAKSTPEFVRMCSDVGLSMEWFDDLARKRMEAFGL